MCRNIRTLHHYDPPVTDAEIHDAALQFVRKVSGFARPSRANAAAFDRAVSEVSASVHQLLATLVSSTPPRNRETEAARARVRSARRFGTRGDPGPTST